MASDIADTEFILRVCDGGVKASGTRSRVCVLSVVSRAVTTPRGRAEPPSELPPAFLLPQRKLGLGDTRHSLPLFTTGRLPHLYRRLI